MKKKINYILGIFLFSTLFFSCENNMEEVVVTPDNGPENVAVDTDIPLICTADNAKDTVLLFHGRQLILVKIFLPLTHYNLTWLEMILPMHKK